MVAFEMRDMLNETANRSLLPLRKAIIEPVFGQIKFNRGLRDSTDAGSAQLVPSGADLHAPQPAEVVAN